MIRQFSLLATAALLALAPGAASAQGRVVLVIADNADPSTMPESSPIFEKVYDEIADKLSQKGMTARRAADVPAVQRLGARASRDMAAAIEAAREAGGQVAAVLAVKIYVSMRRGSKNNSFELWIDGNAHETGFGKSIALHKIRGAKRHDVERSCGRDCMLETAVEHIPATAADFAKGMARKLADALPR